MKRNHLILKVVLFLSLSFHLILTPSEYVGCQHVFPAECLDLRGICKNLLPLFPKLISQSGFSLFVLSSESAVYAFPHPLKLTHLQMYLIEIKEEARKLRELNRLKK